MRKSFIIAATMLAIFVLASPSVMAVSCFEYLRDDDGDGIPNCLDEDYVKPLDGTGYGKLGPTVSSFVGGLQTGVKEQSKEQFTVREQIQNRFGNVYKLSYKFNWAGNK